MIPLSPGFFLLGIDQLDPTCYRFLHAGHQPIEKSSFLLVHNKIILDNSSAFTGPPFVSNVMMGPNIRSQLPDRSSS